MLSKVGVMDVNDYLADMSYCFISFLQIITEQALISNSKGLQGLYENILDFIPNYCSKLIDVTSGKVGILDAHQGSGGNRAQGIKGYNFVVNSVWPEIASAIQNNLTSIFAPGDPDAFHKVGSRLK